MTELRVIAEPGVPQVIVIREFNAPRELLFRAYTEPELVARWLGPADLELIVNQLDPQHGGRWRWTHYDADGKGYAFHGLYHGTPSPDRVGSPPRPPAGPVPGTSHRRRRDDDH